MEKTKTGWDRSLLNALNLAPKGAPKGHTFVLLSPRAGMQMSLGCSANSLYHFAKKVEGHYLSQSVRTLSHSHWKFTHRPYPISTKKGSL